MTIALIVQGGAQEIALDSSLGPSISMVSGIAAGPADVPTIVAPW